MFKHLLRLVLPLCMAGTAYAADIAKPMTPSDNDAIIKQYLETKDPQYLRTLLQTYAEADDAMLHDARRYAYLVTLTANPKNPRPQLNQTMATAMCKKYQCQPDPTQSRPFMQLMTAASGIWALDSLAQQDPQVQSVITDFLNTDAHMKAAYADEAAQFGNYRTLLTLVTIEPEKVEPLLSRYEQLQPLSTQEVIQTLGMQPVQTPPQP